MRIPALAGTHTNEPGTLRRPGGGASDCSTGAACSGEKTTVWWRMPRARSSLRTTRARPSPSVLEMSQTRSADEIQLARHEIDGVGDVVVVRAEETIPLLRIVAADDRGHGTVRRNVPDAFGHDFGFRAPERRSQRDALPVDIRF